MDWKVYYMIEDEESDYTNYLTGADSERSMLMSLSEDELMAYAESLKADCEEGEED